MKIVVVDGYTLNPGDLSWDGLNSLGMFDVYDDTTEEQVLDRVRDADAILTNKVALPEKLLDQLERLKYVGVTATGVNVIDLEQASQRGITVTNVPGYGTASVAQHVFALLLELTNHVGSTSSEVNQGSWEREGRWCYWNQPLTELADKYLGIIGMGSIGHQVGCIGQAFGMRVIYTSPSAKKVAFNHQPLETVLEEADVLSLNCPLNANTHHLINREHLALMKPSAILINTGRGALIDESALRQALIDGTIAAAGLDVLSTEPPHQNPFIGIPNCIITPHQAWATREARKRLMDIVISNLNAFKEGSEQNKVNG